MSTTPQATGGDRPLSELGLTARGGVDPVIRGLEVDSRRVGEGFLFAALPGSKVHGAKRNEGEKGLLPMAPTRKPGEPSESRG